MDPQARERLNRIRIVKEDKARLVEDWLLQNARSGRLTGKVTEQQLIDVLEGINQQTTKKQESKIKVFPSFVACCGTCFHWHVFSLVEEKHWTVKRTMMILNFKKSTVSPKNSARTKVNPRQM